MALAVHILSNVLPSVGGTREHGTVQLIAEHVPDGQQTLVFPGGHDLEVRALKPTGSSDNATAPIKRRERIAGQPSCGRTHPRGHVEWSSVNIFDRQHSV